MIPSSHSRRHRTKRSRKAELRPQGTPSPVFPTLGSRVRGAVGSICKFVFYVLVAYLVFSVTSDPMPQSISEASCKLPVLPQHFPRYFPHCIREFVPLEEPIVPPEEPIIPPDFVTLIQFQSRLDEVMKDAARSSKVAVDIKDSGMRLRDLRTWVSHSTLSNKDTLGRNLKRFVQDAKATSGNLQQFGGRVWGAVDRVVSLNEHTLIMLESPPTGRGLAKTHQKGLESIWLQGIELLDQTLRKLIHEAQDNVGALQRLEEMLNNIDDMLSTEKHEIDSKEFELKRQWFREMLGLNEEQRQSHGASLELITTVKDDRKHGLKHVMGALDKLKQMSSDLDDLRERVATPMMITGSSNIPVEAHIRKIRSGTERLVNGQARMREIEDEYR